MLIVAFFTEQGVPKEGLSPTIRIRDLSDGSLVITDAALSEKNGGFYSYEFSGYDEDKDYGIVIDGTSVLTNQDRYLSATNETAGVGKILKIEKNKWEISGNQMIFYDDDGTTELYKFNLKNKAGAPTDTDIYKREPV